MAKCKPVTLDQLVGGQHYIHVGVSLGGMMWMTIFVFCGQPIGERKLGCNRQKIRGKVLSSSRWILSFHDGDTQYAGDSGLLPRKHNNHRVFRATTRNHALLTDLVERGALVEYLTLIGDENPIATIATDLRLHEEIMSEMLDDDF